jgi:hypothetical protein
MKQGSHATDHGYLLGEGVRARVSGVIELGLVWFSSLSYGLTTFAPYNILERACELFFMGSLRSPLISIWLAYTSLTPAPVLFLNRLLTCLRDFNMNHVHPLYFLLSRRVSSEDGR